MPKHPTCRGGRKDAPRLGFFCYRSSWADLYEMAMANGTDGGCWLAGIGLGVQDTFRALTQSFATKQRWCGKTSNPRGSVPLMLHR